MARRRPPRAIAGIGCAWLAALLLAGPAAAKIVNLHVYNGVYPAGSISGAGSVGGTAPFPNNMQVMSIFQETGQLFVGNGNAARIYKFSSTGTPEEFSGVAPPGTTTLVQSFNNFGDIAVDNSSTATKGRIYAHNEGGPLNAFKPSGEPVGAPFPLSISALCGVDVAPNGNIWTASWNGNVQEFNSSGVAITEGPAGGHFETPRPCAIAIDSNENFYFVEEFGGLVRKYNNAGVLQGTVDSDTSLGEPRDITVDRSNNHLYVDHRSYISEYDAAGGLIQKFGEAEGAGYPATASLLTSNGLAVNEGNHMVYATNNRLSEGSRHVDEFKQLPPTTIPDVTTEPPETTATTAVLKGKVSQDIPNAGSKIVFCKFEWGPGTGNSYPNSKECEPAAPLEGENIAVKASIEGLTKGATYHYRLVAKSENGISSNGADVQFKASGPPSVTEDIVSDVNTDSVRLLATIDPNGGDTEYHFEFGPTPAYGMNLPMPDGKVPSGSAQTVSVLVPGLSPDTVYHFRVVAHNTGGTTEGSDRELRTFPLNPTEPDPCPNAQVRQQTGASLLLDCRAYELTSAVNTGGYDVQSDLIPGQATLKPEPGAPDRVLYSVHFGAIPNTGEPTNHGLDPYVATRGATGWSTAYVGIPAGGTPSAEPFGSPLAASSSTLGAFAFGGEGLCSPCFADGSTGIPVRMANGALVQGMSGEEPVEEPIPAGTVLEPLSADGSHFVFGSTQKFEPDGVSGQLAIYDRNLSGATHLVSKKPGGGNLEGPGIAELGISNDGSRILIGTQVGAPDEAGNSYWHLYMNVGDSPQTIDLTPGTTTGVLYDGMTGDGARVFFTTRDKLLGGDTDASADLYRADVTASASTLTAVTTTNYDECTPVPGKEGPYWNNVAGPANCDVVGLAGGAGVAEEDGSAYFLSPEELDGAAEEDEPNLYVAAPGGSPKFVATIEPNGSTVADAVLNNEVRSFSDFQVTPNGRDAVFASSLPLTGFQNLGHSEIFRYDTVSGLDCVSCAVTGAGATGDATLSDGLNLAADGTVFFTSSEPLVLRDTNGRKDVYEWEEGVQQLISTGLSDFDSGLLSVSQDGVNAYFFTRATLAPQDENGNLMKIYDARAGGGFLVFPSPPLCAAADECHGAGTQAAPPPQIGSFVGKGGNARVRKCKKGFVKKHGRCVKKKKKHHKNKRGSR
jgi:hypothetical protein